LQSESLSQPQVKSRNEMLRFKCLAYSVAESSKFVILTVERGTNSNMIKVNFGIRTIEGTAKENVNFKEFNQTHFLKSN